MSTRVRCQGARLGGAVASVFAEAARPEAAPRYNSGEHLLTEAGACRDVADRGVRRSPCRRELAISFSSSFVQHFLSRVDRSCRAVVLLLQIQGCTPAKQAVTKSIRTVAFVERLARLPVEAGLDGFSVKLFFGRAFLFELLGGGEAKQKTQKVVVGPCLRWRQKQPSPGREWFFCMAAPVLQKTCGQRATTGSANETLHRSSTTGVQFIVLAKPCTSTK